MPVTTGLDLSSFEKRMQGLTLGYCLARSMAFATFRRTVLQYHVTGKPSSFRSILANNHLISVEDGVATLYRNMEDDNPTTDGDHTTMDMDTTTDDGEPPKTPPRKRARARF